MKRIWKGNTSCWEVRKLSLSADKILYITKFYILIYAKYIYIYYSRYTLTPSVYPFKNRCLLFISICLNLKRDRGRQTPL